MKKLFFLLFSFLLTFSIFPQGEEGGELIPECSLWFGVKGSGIGTTEEITHTMTAQGTVWYYSGGSLLIDTQGNWDEVEAVTTGVVGVGGALGWQGGNFPFNDLLNYNDFFYSLAIYKITNSENSNEYFYLDLRDAHYILNNNYWNPDAFILYNDDDLCYNMDDDWSYVWNEPEISPGDYINIAELHNEDPVTDGLQNFWSNALVMVDDGDGHPYLMWGVYPDEDFSLTHYKIYKKIGGGAYSLLTTTSNPYYIDTNQDIYYGPPHSNQSTVYYYVKAYGTLNGSAHTTGASNVVDADILVDPPSKNYPNHNNDILAEEFDLLQNYPNPFNPSTIISYSIKEKSNVTLSVYNTLGQLVAVPFEGFQEKGVYSISFDASELPAGLYLYRLNAGKFVSTKKMLLLK